MSGTANHLGSNTRALRSGNGASRRALALATWVAVITVLATVTYLWSASRAADAGDATQARSSAAAAAFDERRMASETQAYRSAYVDAFEQGTRSGRAAGVEAGTATGTAAGRRMAIQRARSAG